MTGTSYNGHAAARRRHHRGRGPRGDHPRRPQHVVLPLLPLERAGALARRVSRRGHRRPLRLHLQRRSREAAVLHRDRARRDGCRPRPHHRRLQRLLGREGLPQPHRRGACGHPDGPRLQRLERDARAQLPDHRGAQAPGACRCRSTLPPGGTRRPTAPVDDEPLVHGATCWASRTASRTTPGRGSCAKCAAGTRGPRCPNPRPTRTTRIRKPKE